MTRAQIALPVDEIIPGVLASLKTNPSLVIEAPPGTGKTTRVPPALLEIVRGEVLVLEPRRIAARMSARRVAAELGEEVGGTVGYQVRFEDVSGPRTRLRFVTEGVLTRRMLSDRMLRGVDGVVLDEFHERHLDSDLALALLKRLQEQRPELRLVVMSATLDTGPVAEYLGGCPVLQSQGRAFPLEVRHLPYSPATLQVQVKNALGILASEGHTGHTLVFLPGAAEIRRAMRECEGLAQGADLIMLPLHGDLSPAEQDRAVAPSQQRKVILATNVAESSITVDGVTAVIDSGLARIASYSPWTGLPTLEVGRISKASAKQRAGRAGRTGPGVVLRLYPEADYAQRTDHDEPEITRSDLSQICLSLRGAAIPGVRALDWLTTPPEAAVQSAETLLDRLGAQGAVAEEMLRYPVDPRLSRILVEAKRRGVGEQGCKAVALLSSGERTEHTDLLSAIDAPLDGRTQQVLKQLRKAARITKQGQRDDEALLLSVLAGFPDRVARVRSGTRVQLTNGASAELMNVSRASEFLLALEIEDRKEKPLPLVRMTANIQPEWLLDLFPDRVVETDELVWDREAERVDAVSSLRYDELKLQETRGVPVDAEAATEMLVQKAMEAGLERFVDGTAWHELRIRIELAGLPQPDVTEVLREVAAGQRSFAGLRGEADNFLPLFESKTDRQLLQQRAPATVLLQGGRQTKVHYEEGKSPWIASRLQDFFGMQETPRVGRDGTPVVVHLLAPNHRAVQTTTDLAGFWQRLYPGVRKELMRRYPRHAWPERPV